MTDTERLESPVRALRDSFGDRKLPDISRKITACVACRKQKIRCHMQDSKPPCTRCKKRGLSCTVNRSLQMLLESDTSWKHSMEKKMQNLEATIEKMANHIQMPEMIQHAESQNNGTSTHESQDASRNGNIADRNQTDPSQTGSPHGSHWEVVMDLESGPGVVPGFYIHQTPTNSNSYKDIISRGTISLENAQRYWETYRNRLDHFPYRILGDHGAGTLESIRDASPLLMTAVCTVGALHLASEDFNACYDNFLSLSATCSFSKGHTVDDVRALCIGAFWLSDLSWTLVGAAVRMATELQLHRSIFKALQGDREHYLRTRLYYLVYACDHHFSVAFGRPPMTRECEAVQNIRRFIKCEHATEDDTRLASQVLRWSICSNIYDTLGIDVDKPLSDLEIPLLRQFAIALDTLRAEWADTFFQNDHIGNYPRKGVGLQYHFAKLYLCSHAFRGIGSQKARSRSQDSILEMDEVANSAVLSALSILRAVVSDTEIQSFLDGLPTYFHTMIAFAAVFLLKVSTKFSTSVQIDIHEVTRLMTSLVTTLKRVASTMHPRHLLVSIARGIDSLLQRCDLANNAVPVLSINSHQAPIGQIPNDFERLNGASDWTNDGSFDPNFMGEYDFLLSQDMDFSLDFPFENRFPLI